MTKDLGAFVLDFSHDMTINPSVTLALDCILVNADNRYTVYE